ncbi:alpha/beta hydrolase [Acidobacteria bacterium AH-259-D05]|nr:alpha/beta hydrolase [Acidobacteria bacterium AH-259-D05]
MSVAIFTCAAALTALSLEVLGAGVDLPPQVTHLEAFHRSGQTFLTFREVQIDRAGRVQYRIYRSAKPLRQIDGLKPLATISQDSSYNLRASDRRVEGHRVQLRIEEGKDVPSGRGLFVYTVPEDGQHYYAVTAVVDGQENREIGSANSLAESVAETVALPEPIFQGMTRAADGLLARRYVHFVNANPTPLLPPMVNSYDTRRTHFNFLLRNADPQANQPQPLVIGFHGGGDIFTAALQPTGNPKEILIGLDHPYAPNGGYPPAVNTLWFGYAPSLGQGQPQEAGVVEPYTLRRVRYVVKWVERTFQVDKNRVYCAGTSFGAIGSLMYGLSYPHEIAAMWLNVPRYDFRADGPEAISDTERGTISAWDVERGWQYPTSARFNPIFGTRDQNLPTRVEEHPEFRAISDGLGIYDRVNFRNIVSRFPEVDLPIMLIYHGKLDNITGWHEKPLMVQALEEARQPFQFYFFTAGHFLREEKMPSDFFRRAYSRSRLNQYRFNEAYVAFSQDANKDDLGDGYDMVRCRRSSRTMVRDTGGTASWVQECLDSPLGLISGDAYGTINGYLDWNRIDWLDLPYQFEVTVLVLEAAEKDETTVDVTLRRLQNLRHKPGQKYRFENLGLQSGQAIEPPREVQADELGRIVIPQVKVRKAGSRLRLQTI